MRRRGQRRKKPTRKEVYRRIEYKTSLGKVRMLKKIAEKGKKNEL